MEPHREKTNNVVINRSDIDRAIQAQKMARGWKY